MLNGISKSKENAVIFGVLGGLGEYFNIDPVLLRVLVVVAGVASGGFPIVVVYLLLALIVPEEPRGGVNGEDSRRPYEDTHRKKQKRFNDQKRPKRKEAEDVEEDDWSDF